MTMLKARSAAPGALWGLAVAAVSLGLSVAGCEDRAPPTAPGAKAPATAGADATYTTRGRVESLPAKPGATMVIRHESIPDFRSKAGAVVGMGSMAMPFMPAEGLDLSGIAPGDAVEFTWEVRWNTRPNSRVVRIAKLPPGTELDLGGAARAGESK
jgi:hypothetical protein